MLLPKEKPFMEGLNSYYLHLKHLIEHLQGEIGCGCIHGKAVTAELLIFFDENELIRCLIKNRESQPQSFTDLELVEQVFAANSFIVNIYSLDPNAIFFWGQMPKFHWAKSTLRSTEIPLPDLIFRLRQKDFSGFIEVMVSGNQRESGLLFFHEGVKIGGSYSWGEGGMSKNNDDYTLLLNKVQQYEGVFTFGSFIKDESSFSDGTGEQVHFPSKPHSTKNSD